MLSTLIRSEIEQAASRNGFPIDPERQGDWLLLRSPWTRHTLLATHDGTRYLVATSSRAIAQDADGDWPAAPAPPGAAVAFAGNDATGLHRLIQRLYRLARSLPPEPLSEFRERTRSLPAATEAERLVIQRIGQDVFRDSLMEDWNGRCPLTGIADPALLRASHIVPWSECADDAQRLDVYNGLLLSALWDAAFDSGLVSFAADGTPVAGSNLSNVARTALGFPTPGRVLGLRDRHQHNLLGHRKRNGFVL